MLIPDEAKRILSENISTLAVETKNLLETVGFCCATDIQAVSDMPNFDNSAMDGYAICSADIQTPPFRLELTSDLMAAGSTPSQQLLSGQAVRIFTGAMLPRGADTVVAQERVTRLPGNYIQINSVVKRADFVRHKASDVKKGTILLPKGEILTPLNMAVLAAQGICELPVYKRPVVGFLMTGNELCAATETPLPGQIRSSNDYLLHALLQPICQKLVNMGHAKDDPQDLLQKILKFAADLDVILISGGASVGDYDYTKSVITELGYDILFERIASRPGRPLIFARQGKKILFGIPGNPVSSFVVYEQFIKRAILQMSGQVQKRKRMLCKLLQSHKKSVDLELYLKGRIVLAENSNCVDTDFNQNSGALLNLSMSDCLVFLPYGRDSFSAGEMVEVLPFNFGEQWN